MQFAIALIIFVLILGVYEQIKHNKNLNLINLRINVNGTRGKSTATRLITGILKEAGVKVVGKTTGTSARIIYWNKEEEPIKRGRLGPNIIEQKNGHQKSSKAWYICICNRVYGRKSRLPDYVSGEAC